MDEILETPHETDNITGVTLSPVLKASRPIEAKNLIQELEISHSLKCLCDGLNVHSPGMTADVTPPIADSDLQQ